LRLAAAKVLAERGGEALGALLIGFGHGDRSIRRAVRRQAG